MSRSALLAFGMVLVSAASAAAQGPVHPFIRPDLAINAIPAQIPAPVPYIPTLDPEVRPAALYYTSIPLAAGATVWDNSVSQYNFDHGISREGNAILSQSNAQRWSLSLGITGGVMVANHYLVYKKGHTKAAIAVNLVITALHVGAAIYGIKQR